MICKLSSWSKLESKFNKYYTKNNYKAVLASLRLGKGFFVRISSEGEQGTCRVPKTRACALASSPKREQLMFLGPEKHVHREKKALPCLCLTTSTF